MHANVLPQTDPNKMKSLSHNQYMQPSNYPNHIKTYNQNNNHQNNYHPSGNYQNNNFQNHPQNHQQSYQQNQQYGSNYQSHQTGHNLNSYPTSRSSYQPQSNMVQAPLPTANHMYGVATQTAPKAKREKPVFKFVKPPEDEIDEEEFESEENESSADSGIIWLNV